MARVAGAGHRHWVFFGLTIDARQLLPKIKVVLVSGYASSFGLAGGVTAELLQKPYRDEDLKRTLSQALARDGSDAKGAARRSSAAADG